MKTIILILAMLMLSLTSFSKDKLYIQKYEIEITILNTLKSTYTDSLTTYTKQLKSEINDSLKNLNENIIIKNSNNYKNIIRMNYKIDIYNQTINKYNDSIIIIEKIYKKYNLKY